MRVVFNMSHCRAPGIKLLEAVMFDKEGVLNKDLTKLFSDFNVTQVRPLIWEMKFEKNYENSLEKSRGFIEALRELYPWFIFEAWVMQKNNFPDQHFIALWSECALPKSKRESVIAIDLGKFDVISDLVHPTLITREPNFIKMFYEKLEEVTIKLSDNSRETIITPMRGIPNTMRDAKGELSDVIVIIYKGIVYGDKVISKAELKYNKNLNVFTFNFHTDSYYGCLSARYVSIVLSHKDLFLLTCSLQRYCSDEEIDMSERLVLTDLLDYYTYNFIPGWF